MKGAVVSMPFGASLLLLHLILLASVFDIYFRSPVMPSAVGHAPDYDQDMAPARRLVLFVADGLRADSLFQNSVSRTPYLKKVIKHLGAWGVSHTRVPTESRPGHVALVAGMPEDPSAIFSGWTTNPVEVDTVFNASFRTFAWGSPGILDLFSGNSRMECRKYDPAWEDFSVDSDPTLLDTWVFDSVEDFFQQAKFSDDFNLRTKLRSDRLIFFLPLSGLDTQGHTRKPLSKSYDRHLETVDAGIRKTVDTIESFWGNDGRTAYIFTSDHGMTDWGSHGAGSDHETQTPLLVWGSGFRLPKSVEVGAFLDTQTEGWGLNSTARSDIRQTDVAPLIAAILGLEMPRNSIGRLPIDLLDFHPSDLLRAVFANARQIHEQYSSYRRLHDGAFYHNEFSGLSDATYNFIKTEIERLNKLLNFDEALHLANQLIDLSLEGLFYYQKYHRGLLYVATFFSYVGIISCLSLHLATRMTPWAIRSELSLKERNFTFRLTSLLVALCALFPWIQNVPYYYFVFLSTPVLVWSVFFMEIASTRWLLQPLNVRYRLSSLTRTLVASAVVLQLLVLSFFERRFLTPAIAIMMLWYLHAQADSPSRWRSIWCMMCFLLAFFSFQPAVGKEKYSPYVFLAGVLSSTLGLLVYMKRGNDDDGSSPQLERLGIYANAVLLPSSGLCVIMTNSGYALPAVRFFSRMIVFASIPLALVTRHLILPRLLSLCMSLQGVYLLLSLDYEGLFLLCLAVTLCIWVVFESEGVSRKCRALTTISLLKVQNQRRFLNAGDIRRSISFLFFALVSFFGTGNIASLNSFDPRSIQTLVSAYNPFLMGFLLLCKVLIPFLVVACFALVVRDLSGMPNYSLFLIVLLFSDLMGFEFFFLVTDEGSWEEIGTSLSHYVIIHVTAIFLQVFLLLAKALMLFSAAKEDQLEAGEDNSHLVQFHLRDGQTQAQTKLA